jgi:preprotein translocase subunit SecA
MRIFGSERISGLMQKMGVEEGEVIEHGMVTSAIGRAQKRVEAHNFDIRKHLLEYDTCEQTKSLPPTRRGLMSRTSTPCAGDLRDTVAERASSARRRQAAPAEWNRGLADELGTCACRRSRED